MINHIKEEINFDWGRLLEDLHRLAETLTQTNPDNMFSLNLSFLPQVELPRASPNRPPEGLPVHPRQVGQSIKCCCYHRVYVCQQRKQLQRFFHINDERPLNSNQSIFGPISPTRFIYTSLGLVKSKHYIAITQSHYTYMAFN